MTNLFLIVRLAGERVVVPAADVEAVVEIEAITPIPRAAAHVAGLAALRSRVLTVIDSEASLGLSPRATTGSDALVAVADGHAYALLVDGVDDVVETIDEPVPVKSTLGPGWRRVARGMIDAEGDLLLLVDVRAFIEGAAAEAA